MKMRDILCNQEARQSLATNTTRLISRHGADDPDPFCSSGIDYGAATHSIDCDSINQVGVAEVLSGTDVSSEETEAVRLNTGETEPSHLNPDAQGGISWEEAYKLLWEYKVSVWEKNHPNPQSPQPTPEPLLDVQPLKERYTAARALYRVPLVTADELLAAAYPLWQTHSGSTTSQGCLAKLVCAISAWLFRGVYHRP